MDNAHVIVVHYQNQTTATQAHFDSPTPLITLFASIFELDQVFSRQSIFFQDNRAFSQSIELFSSQSCFFQLNRAFSKFFQLDWALSDSTKLFQTWWMFFEAAWALSNVSLDWPGVILASSHIGVSASHVGKYPGAWIANTVWPCLETRPNGFIMQHFIFFWKETTTLRWLPCTTSRFHSFTIYS